MEKRPLLAQLAAFSHLMFSHLTSRYLLKYVQCSCTIYLLSNEWEEFLCLLTITVVTGLDTLDKKPAGKQLSIMIGTLILCVFFLYVLFLWLTRRPYNFPPGLPIVPILGSIPFLPRKLVHIVMAKEWRPKYGPIVGLFLGFRPAVAVCGGREVIEVLRREEFQGRPDGPFFRERSFGERLGVFFSEGAFWVEQRRFTLRHLRDFGFGKRSMEVFIMEEIEDTVKEMKCKGTIEATTFFNISTLNVLWGMIAGKRYSRDDVELQGLLKKVTRSFRSGNPAGSVSTSFPILNRVAPSLTGYNDFVDSLTDLQNFFRKAIKEHKETLNEDNPRDLIDVYLREIKLQSKNPESTFTENGLITVCLDLFAAGGETTTSTLGFCLLYMILHPTVQQAVQRELDAVVGRERRPSLDDRPQLHYVEAVLAELMRVCSIAPMTPPHRVTRDTTLGGHFIPKDSMMLLNLYSVFQDEEHWSDPQVFRPERFLNPDGKFVKDEWLIPFGAGKRVCVGEVLARSNVFLFFTTLLQEFSFSVPEGDPQPSTIPLSGFTIAPQPFRVKATTRV